MLIHLPDLVNAIACLVLMCCLVPVANIISPRKHGWYTALVIAVSLVLLQCFLEFFDPDSQPLPWSVALLHALWAAALLVCRRRAWLFVKVELGSDRRHPHPARRADDIKSAVGAS